MLGHSCPICRGEFGVLEERPPNILLQGIVQSYFPVEYERKRRQRELEPESEVLVAPPEPLVLRVSRPAIPPSIRRPRSSLGSLAASFILFARRVWPYVRYVLPGLYPLFLVFLYLVLFGPPLRSARVVGKRKPRFALPDFE